jgi:hypothetical protein
VLSEGSGLLIVAAIAAVVVVALVVGMIFLYISSRMRFVLFESVVRGECRIRESWRKYGGPAFRYFVWQAAFLVVAMCAVAVFIGLPIWGAYQWGIFESPRDHLLALIAGGIVLLFDLFLLFAIFMVTQTLTKDFVVPQMALEDITAIEGWRRLWRIMKSEKGGYAAYLGMKFVLGLGVAILNGVAGVLLMLIVVIPIGGAGLFAVMAGSAAGMTWNPLTVAIAVAVILLVVLALMLAISFISVPAMVFFPAYSLYFFADRYPPVHRLMFPAPPVLG